MVKEDPGGDPLLLWTDDVLDSHIVLTYCPG